MHSSEMRKYTNTEIYTRIHSQVLYLTLNLSLDTLRIISLAVEHLKINLRNKVTMNMGSTKIND